jgi:hypothetical protein
MARFSSIVVTGLVILSIVLMGMPSTVLAAGNGTSIDTLTLTATFECISVYSNFSDDDNGNNQATLEYREIGGSWKQGMSLTADRRAQIMENDVYIDNPYKYQWRG